MKSLEAGLLAMAIALGATTPLWAGTIRADQDPSLYLNLGAESKYASVGRLDATASSGSYVGSGTLIAPDWVLTAAHVVDSAKSETFTINGKQYAASGWEAYPSWNGNLGAGYDIGLVHLSTPVTGVAPAQLYTGSSEQGKVGTFVGYGMTGTGKTGAVTFDGQKRAGQNVLDAFYTGSSTSGRILMSDFDNPTTKTTGWVDNTYGSSNALPMEYLISPGDSGGGMFIDTAAGTWLAGINSFGASMDSLTDSSYGDLSGVTRVSAFASWIGNIIAGDPNAPATDQKKASEGGGEPSILSAVPEPATLSLLGVGLLALLRRRRAGN